MISMSSVTPQYEKPRRRRQFKEMKLFEFDQTQEETLKLLEEVRNHSAKQFDYIMDVGNEISKHAKNEDLEALQEVVNRNIDILHLLRMHIEETFEQVLQFRFDDILEYFLENGFNIKDDFQDCLIDLCITSRFFASDPPTTTLRLLIKYGADVDALEKDRYRTPMHYAAKYGILEFVKVLLEYKAEVDPIDFKKRTPLNYAMKKKNLGSEYKQICELLEQKGGTTKWNQYVTDNNVY
ncbi:hypothetical protein ABPG74_014458 [Tetrahymena malaccensis]